MPGIWHPDAEYAQLLVLLWLLLIMFLFIYFVQTGPASGGWTSTPPLSALGEASAEGSKIGMDLWLVGMALFIVSSSCWEA